MLQCPKCASSNIRWVTLRRTVPVDVLQCQDCGHALAEEDWVAPLLPLQVGRCVNCGDRRNNRGVCQGCGLSEAEDQQVHDELRQIVLPTGNHLAAAREASRQGRRLIGLKLASQAAAMDEDGQGDAARGLRVWLLSAIGESQAALEDCKTWVETSADPHGAAWASLGHQYQHAGFPGSAADAYAKSLTKNANQQAVRARRALLLLQMRREGQARDEAIAVLKSGTTDEQALGPALEVIEKIAESYEGQLRDDEVELLVKDVGPMVERSARLLAHRARVFALAGDLTSAKRDLKAARKIVPDLPVYAKVEATLRPQRSSWWRW